jgi:hypothetical protein
MFTSITFFISLDAIRSFAGDDYELAVVEEASRQALSRWDERVSHHDVVAELEGSTQLAATSSRHDRMSCAQRRVRCMSL